MLGGVFGGAASIRTNTNVDTAMKAAGIDTSSMTKAQLQDAREAFYNQVNAAIKTEWDSQYNDIRRPDLYDQSAFAQTQTLKNPKAEVEPGAKTAVTEASESGAARQYSAKDTAAANKTINDTMEQFQELPKEVISDTNNQAVMDAYYAYGLNPSQENASKVLNLLAQNITSVLNMRQANGKATGGDAKTVKIPRRQAAKLQSLREKIGGHLDLLSQIETAATEANPSQDNKSNQDLYLEYAEEIGDDEMMSFEKFVEMRREGGDAWKELTLKKGYKAALNKGDISLFTTFDQYKKCDGLCCEECPGYGTHYMAMTAAH